MELTKYKLGDLLTLEIQKNKDCTVDLSKKMSVTLDKVVVPTIRPGSSVTTNPAQYCVVKEGQFVYNTMLHSGCGVPIGRMYQSVGLVSGVYNVFSVHRTDLMDPEYFRLFVSTPEFDYHGDRVASGSAQPLLNWAKFTSLEIGLPTIEVQREVVRKFAVVEKLINKKRELYKYILEAVDLLFKESFMDPTKLGLQHIDYGNKYRLSEFATLFTGSKSAEVLTSQRSTTTPIPVFQNSEFIETIHGFTSVPNVIGPSVNITSKGKAGTVFARYQQHFLSNSSKSLSVDESLSTVEYLTFALKNMVIPVTGSTQAGLPNSILLNLEFSLPPLEQQQSFTKASQPLLKLVENLVFEIRELEETKAHWLECFDPKIFGKPVA